MKINNYVSWIKDDDETVLINTKTQLCILLDYSGEIIWNSLCDTLSLEKTIYDLTNKFSDSDFDKIKKDITELYNTLLENNIINEEE